MIHALNAQKKFPSCKIPFLSSKYTRNVINIKIKNKIIDEINIIFCNISDVG